jgi:hypothetical protein
MRARTKTVFLTSILLALVLAISGVAQAPAAKKPSRHAKVPADFYGVVPLTDPGPADLSRMAGGGIETVRVYVFWGRIQPLGPATFDWSAYDKEIGDIARAGLTPSPQVASSPGWISANQYRPPIYDDAQKVAWQSFLTAFVKRYGRGGSFWAEHPEVPYKPATSYEIWNEPNLDLEWGGPPNANDYLTLLRLSQQSIKQADPAGAVVFGGLFPFPIPDQGGSSPGYGVPAKQFLKSFFSNPGANRTFDALSLHPFSQKARDVVPTMRIFRRLLDRHRDRRTPLWITELGWSTGGKGWAGSPYQATERKQAINLRQSFSALIAARKSLRLQRVYWHDWQDSPDPNADNVYQMGLLRGNGTPKPAWKAYKSFARR